MAGKNKVEVRICGKDYTIVGFESDEYMQRVGLYVDKKMTEILKSNSQLSTSMASVLTAINIADEYFKYHEMLERTKEELRSVTEQAGRLKQELAKVTEEADMLKIRNTELQLELVRKQTENEAYVKKNQNEY